MLKLKLSGLQNGVKYEMSVIDTFGKKNILSRNVNLYKLYKEATTDAILCFSFKCPSHFPYTIVPNMCFYSSFQGS